MPPIAFSFAVTSLLYLYGFDFGCFGLSSTSVSSVSGDGEDDSFGDASVLSDVQDPSEYTHSTSYMGIASEGVRGYCSALSPT